MIKYILAFIIVFPLSAHAARIEGSGLVNMIGVNSYDMWGEAQSTYFTLDGFTSAGNCKKSGSLVAIRIRAGEGGNRQLALITSAQMAGKRIKVSVDDVRVDTGGTCIVRWLQLLK